MLLPVLEDSSSGLLQPTSQPSSFPSAQYQYVCGAAASEGNFATVLCPTGLVISNIEFASYGVPGGVLVVVFQLVGAILRSVRV